MPKHRRRVGSFPDYSGRAGHGGEAIKGVSASGSWNGLLARVLARQHVRAVYQPIVRLDNRSVIAYEALARPENSADDSSVEEFFAAAARQGVVRDLDWLSRRAAISGARPLPHEILLFLNVSDAARENPWMDLELLQDLLDAIERPLNRVALELVRPEAVEWDRVMAGAEPYREKGVRLAAANLNTGDDVFHFAPEHLPDLFKFSRQLVAESENQEARAYVEKVVRLARERKRNVIAEGIETEEQLQRMRELGVEIGQGYLLGRPAAMAIASVEPG